MKKNLVKLLVLGALIAMAAVVYGYTQLFSSNTAFKSDSNIVLLREKMNAQELADHLFSENVITDKSSFLLACKIKRFSSSKKPGRFELKKGWGNQDIINAIRSGNQAPVNIRFGTEKSLEELAGNLGSVLLSDSTTFSNAFKKAILDNTFGIEPDHFACLFLADTYQEFWTVDPDDFIKRMKNNFDQYWNSEKVQLAENLGLTPYEATILASIVKGETGKMEEAPKIAGLYLNRLKINMKLQADPTSLFAASASNVERVTNEISAESPYNTYYISGLPPGPIAFVEKTFLDAVLNPQSHDYLYMCAKPDRSGYHNFSKTFEQHKEYAAEYHRSLNARGIK